MAGDWRVSDAEREAAATALGMHLAAGRLTTAEFQARLEQIYAAVTASDLARVTADLPAAAPSAGWGSAGTAGTGGFNGPGLDGPGLQRVLRRVLAAALGLIVMGVVGAILLIGALAGNAGLLLPSLILLAAPVVIVGALAGGVAWASRRAWRRAAWLEVIPFTAGAPWLGGAMRLTRLLLAGKVAWRILNRLGRPMRHRRLGPVKDQPPAGGVWYQTEPGGDWRQARVGDLRGTTR